MQNNYPSSEVSTDAARHRRRSTWWLYSALGVGGGRSRYSISDYNKPASDVKKSEGFSWNGSLRTILPRAGAAGAGRGFV